MNSSMVNDITIDVKNVSFGYESGNQILKNISLSADGQENIGLIGANGVGKSTLLRLLIGLNLGFDGEIQIEGIPVAKKKSGNYKGEDGICISGFRESAFYVKCL